MKEGQNSTIDDKEITELLDKGYQINSGLKFGLTTESTIMNQNMLHG